MRYPARTNSKSASKLNLRRIDPATSQFLLLCSPAILGYGDASGFGCSLTMALTRRLSAILAADVAGYTRLMRADEEGTHERLMAHRRELLDPKIEDHQAGS